LLRFALVFVSLPKKGRFAENRRSATL